MAENKFIERLQGKDTAKAVLEIKNSGSKTSFTKMPQGTSDATFVYSDSNHNATAVLKNAINWKVISTNLDLSDNVSGDGDDYTGESTVSGISDMQGNNLWINSSYTVPADGMVFTKNTKWVLKLCGDNLLEKNGTTIDFTVIIVLGASNIISKTFTVQEQASFFCKELVIDFADSNDTVIKLEPSDTITLKLLSNSANASARIYQGMTTLTALQRRVDSDAVASDTRTLDDIEEDVDDLLDNVDYLQDHIIVKSSTMPTASADLVGQVYQYTGTTTYPYEHGFIYECIENAPGVYSWQRMDVQPGGSRGRFLSLWNCATGLAMTNPPISPYEYKAGDYFIVSNVSSGTNYKPTGTEYVIGTASTVVESSEVFVDDTYFFDGTTWKLQNTSNDIKALVDTKVSKDGTSIMTGPLKFRAGSFEGAIAGGLGDGISIYKMKADGSIDSEVASLTKTNGFVPGTTNTLNIGSSALKWKDAYIARVITAVLNNGGDIAIPNDTGTMALTKDIKDSTINLQLNGAAVDSFTLNQDTDKTINITSPAFNITNCITNIPQDIKLEFDTTTKILTLKAGSKLYVPNGASTFDVVNITTDQTLTNTFGGQYDEIFVFWDSVNNTFRQTPTVNSGDTDPSTVANRIWYDTVNNKIKYYANSGTTVTSDSISLPFCIMQNAGGGNGFTKIQQVFNGFGYIGRSTFVLPGVKALLPDGYNADGTSKNIELNFTGVTVKTHTISEGSLICFLASNGINAYGVANYFESDTMPTGFGTYATWYDTKNNFIWGTGDGGTTWTKYTRIYLGKMVKLITGTGNITLFAPHDVFRAVDYEHVKDMMTTDTPQAVTAIKSLQAADDDEWQIKKLNADNTASSQSVQTAAAFRVRDKNDLIMGDLRVIRDTNGTVTTSMYARNRATGSDVNAVISCSVNNAGTVSTSAPALDTANSILTTLAKSKAQSGYYKLGNGLIIQWMCGISPAQNTPYSLPTAFTSGTSYSTVVVHNGSSDDAWQTSAYNQTATTVSFHRGSGLNTPYNVICIGY